jgi:hypothetical protein
MILNLTQMPQLLPEHLYNTVSQCPLRSTAIVRISDVDKSLQCVTTDMEHLFYIYINTSKLTSQKLNVPAPYILYSKVRAWPFRRKAVAMLDGMYQ